ncbi:putative next to BRCA1 gene 1 protein [Xylogone sp. PMI_703]|nr:putative next to BRCA1 gene 1 protein [Xylogone sp. PMI_703]
MASTAVSPTNPETLVNLKINIEGTNRRFKLPLRDLGASTLPDKLRALLAIPPNAEAIFERYSDSAAAFVVLDPNNASVYKQLYRAAKAKLKLRLKVTVKEKEPVVPKPATVEDEEPIPAEAAPQHEDVPEAPAPTNETSTANESVQIPIEDNTASTGVYNESGSAYLGELQRRLEELLITGIRTKCEPMPDPVPAQQPISQMEDSSSTSVPVTESVTAHDKWFSEPFTVSQEREDAIREIAESPAPPLSIFSVYCNNCNSPIPDEHYHCSTCDDGDFDLCQKCIDNGVTCHGDDHWMIKRYVKNGKVVNSLTATIAPKRYSEESKTIVNPSELEIATRTCNSCVEEFTEENFVTCTSCDDFDLCIPCHIGNRHGHNPKHAFIPAVEDTNLEPLAQILLAAGRNVSHNAICDGCDKYIYGVRHKCLDCPDWDYCSSCIVNANFIHPSHRFVPVYEPLTDSVSLTRAFASKARHHGIYCDGPLCKNTTGLQSYIKGDRYKCAVCDDLDFCANCEASPANEHNKTHPLIKFKTPVRNVCVTTMGDHQDGQPMPIMGDRCRRTFHKATETMASPSANAATQVQTVADLEPTEPESVEPVEIETTKSEEVKSEIVAETNELPAPDAADELIAHFVRDVVVDSTVLPPNTVFEQTWYLRNGGNRAWPAGCSVKFVGGDNMCAINPEHPASLDELNRACESTACATEVAPGEEHGFTVSMRTPNRAGNAISYWRLTGPDGNKFGHRLWCDINVKEEPKVVAEEQPSTPEIKVEESQMVFPKLEKESPVASVHEEAEARISSAPSEADDFEEFVEEDANDDETEDGFMTDEEYDILDASDEEYLVEQGKAARK